MNAWIHRALAVLAIALLAGCGSLPRIVPDMARNAGAPQLEGARGPLTPSRSKEILDGLRAGGKPTDVLERHLALEAAVVDTPLVAGNRVQLLQDGPSTYQAMFEVIGQARDHINMETYILEDDEVGQRFAAALIAKQRAGVQVNLIRDGVGTLHTPKEFFKQLGDAGIRVVEFNPVNPLTAKAGWDVNARDHRKLLIVDGKTAFVGGINISGVYSGGSFGEGGQGSRGPKDGKGPALPWRDTDLRIDGPVVANLQKLFIETWEKQKGPPLGPRQYFPQLAKAGDEVVHAIGGSPDDAYSQIYATLISAIDNAEAEVLLTNAYFVPDPQLLASLKGAVARGVKVTLVLPSSTDSALVFHAGRSYYEELLVAGVQIHERQDVVLHSKTALIDGVWSTVGSTNLDWRSFLHNQEVNVVVLGQAFGQRMRAAFDADLAASKPITLAQWQQRSVADRVKENFGRLWQYWL
ncbi:MAG TPA: phospholipase D-like domain-containing protein [Burkholderiaceae bacterium]|nr:phospholipase D-like domain-containing protein [Burkholderiaceae bacterium]